MCLFVFTLVWFGFKKEKKKCVWCVSWYSPFWLSIDHCLFFVFFFCHCPLSAFVHTHSVIHAWTGSYLCALRKYAHTNIFSKWQTHVPIHNTHTHTGFTGTGSVNFWYYFYRTQVNSSSMKGGGGGGGAEQWLLLWQVLQKHHITMKPQYKWTKKGSTQSVCVSMMGKGAR